MKKSEFFKKFKKKFILQLGLITFSWSILAAQEVSIILAYSEKVYIQRSIEYTLHDNYTTSLFKGGLVSLCQDNPLDPPLQRIEKFKSRLLIVASIKS